MENQIGDITMTVALEKNSSLEQFLSLSEIKPANEYIDGQIYQKPMSQFQHSTFQVEITSRVNQIGKLKKIAFAFPELRCNFADSSIVPDIAVMRWQNIPFQANGWVANQAPLAPDWIIEILSPDQSPLKVMNKIGMAITNGSQLGWLISPAKELIMVYVGDQFPEQKQGADILPVLDVLSDWQPTVNDVFDLLRIN
jgi:Uma2 family endonuclease